MQYSSFQQSGRSPESASGSVLIIALIILAVFTFVGILSMDSVQLDYQMSTNSTYKETSFSASEDGRRAMADLVDEVIYERSWTSPRSKPDIVTINETAFSLVKEETDAELMSPYQAMKRADNVDITIDVMDGTKSLLRADASFVQGVSKRMSGASLSTHAGYEGLGKSVAKGGYSVFVELRSAGQGPSGSRSMTGSEYRAILAN